MLKSVVYRRYKDGLELKKVLKWWFNNERWPGEEWDGGYGYYKERSESAWDLPQCS